MEMGENGSEPQGKTTENVRRIKAHTATTEQIS